jgi:hypothetical protein
VPRVLRALRLCAAFLIAAAIIAAGHIPLLHLDLLVQRETLRAAETVGIMNPAGPLGGQIKGFNYQRYPEWVHPAAKCLAALVAYGPSVALLLLLFHRVGIGPLKLRATVCGNCGAELRNLREARCPACKEAL